MKYLVIPAMFSIISGFSGIDLMSVYNSAYLKYSDSQVICSINPDNNVDLKKVKKKKNKSCSINSCGI